MIGIITLDRLKAAQFELQMHANCGTAGHLYLYRCADFPRLTIAKRSQRPEGVVVAYLVDDNEVDDLSAAVAALNLAPQPEPAPAEQMSLF